jgi:8-oxo-dGTP pyrophosphatase MutT (NUDIX family)
VCKHACFYSHTSRVSQCQSVLLLLACCCCIRLSSILSLLPTHARANAQGAWWWPGGRLLKGETFFAAAIRKAQEETGLDKIRPIQVLGVWNTFFPTSNWDAGDKRGTQTVNAIVLVELLDERVDVSLDETSENYRWIPLDPAAAAGEDKYVQAALQRLQHWDATYCEG